MSSLMASHANCLPIGTRVSDFEIVGLVGEGGFGIVYLAHDVTLDRTVAVKEFMPAAFAGRSGSAEVAVRSNHTQTFAAGLQGFIKEARLLAKFAHPALVEVYRFWEANGTAYMAMRYYPGETLRQQLNRGERKFDEQTIAQVMSPILDALEMLHREQVYHRDIAPDNIMISDGHPVLLDFGSARLVIGDGTQALTTVLKPGYAPVEQYVDDGTMKQGAWTDVYALGGVMYHLATGKAPAQAVSRLLADPLQPVNDLTGGAFSQTFSDAVARAMAVRVEDRIQNVRELRACLGWSTVPMSTRIYSVPHLHTTQAPAALNAGHEPAPGMTSAPAAAPATVSAPSPSPVAAVVAAAGQPAAVKPMATPVATPAAPADSSVSAPIKAPVATVAEAKATSFTAGPGAAFEPLGGGEAPMYRPELPSTGSHGLWWAVGVGVLLLAGVAYWQLRPTATTPATVAAVTAPQPAPAASIPASVPVVSVAASEVVATAAPASSAAPASAAAVSMGSVNLDIRPWGTVVVDGVTRGISSPNQLRRLELTPGRHLLEIAKPDAKPFSQTVDLSAGGAVSIAHSFE